MTGDIEATITGSPEAKREDAHRLAEGKEGDGCPRSCR
jgi:hypothetical protein